MHDEFQAPMEMGTRSGYSDRVSRNSASSSRPRLDAIWSMIPTGAPTNLNLGPLSRLRQRHVVEVEIDMRCASARSRLTSNAALDDKPLPIGTSESTRRSKPPTGKPCWASAAGEPLNVV